MPAPIAPAPITATGASRASAFAIASAPGEPRRALAQERGDALAVVLAEAEHALQVALEVELGLERIRCGRVDRAARRDQPLRRRAREPRHELLDRFRERRIVDGLPDHAPRRRLLG